MARITPDQQRENIAVAYSIIGGIPVTQFDLDRYCSDNAAGVADISCGTIGCTLGWLALHPYFVEQGLSIKRGRVYRVTASSFFGARASARQLFGPKAFDRIFAPYGAGLHDNALIRQHGLTPSYYTDGVFRNIPRGDHKRLALARLYRAYHQFKTRSKKGLSAA